ncbi:MAG TPA: hypothetical protein VLA49_06845 [Anaerolineales bacterium]|nr:hypothetical protein [Anaerolineales bacterium]
MQRVYQQSYHIPGTLAANITITFKTPFDCQLVHVSAGGSNANNGILDIGYIGALEAYVANKDIGDSDSPAEVTRTGFVGGQYPHIAAGTLVNIGLDYDGAGGTATANFTIVLTFTEG